MAARGRSGSKEVAPRGGVAAVVVAGGGGVLGVGLRLNTLFVVWRLVR